MREITHNSFKFLVDTDDWQNQDDAERCSDLIEEMVCRWSQVETRRNHEILTKAVADILDWDDPIVKEITDQTYPCASEVFKSYESGPNTGHNYFLLVNK